MFFILFFYVLNLIILNVVTFPKINLKWSCLLTFFYTPLQKIEIRKTFKVKTKT